MDQDDAERFREKDHDELEEHRPKSTKKKKKKKKRKQPKPSNEMVMDDLEANDAFKNRSGLPATTPHAVVVGGEDDSYKHLAAVPVSSMSANQQSQEDSWLDGKESSEGESPGDHEKVASLVENSILPQRYTNYSDDSDGPQDVETESLRGGGTDKHEDKHDELEGTLTEDIYSLVYTSMYKSQALTFCMCVICFQDILIALILWDLLDNSTNSENPLNVPPGVTTQVRVAEFFALFLALATQSDLVESAVMLHNGYDDRVMVRNPSATKTKWFLSLFFQFLAGGGLLLSNFILVMKSSTVIDMMLNFAALTFVSEIDDVAFAMAKRGFVSDRVQQEAQDVTELRVPVRPLNNAFRRAALLFVFGGLMAAYGLIVHAQNSGKFLCKSIELQLGDEFDPLASTFSGTYDRRTKIMVERFTYTARKNKSVMLGYCKSERAWALTVTSDPCDWVAISPNTETFDVIETSDSSWRVWDAERRQGLPFQRFYMACNDCKGSFSKGRCSARGECVDNVCICDEGRHGRQCQFSSPCPELVVDARRNSFPSEFAVDFISDEYSLLRDESNAIVTAYEKPVYVHENEDEWSIMLFLGRRWTVTSSFLIDPLNKTNLTTNDIVEYLDSFHAFFSDDYIAVFMSDPMDAGTPSDAFSPEGLSWFRVKTNALSKLLTNTIDLSQPLNTVILCAVCEKEENACFNNNECLSGSCNCTEGFEGSLCELNLNDVKKNGQ